LREYNPADLKVGSCPFPDETHIIEEIVSTALLLGNLVMTVVIVLKTVCYLQHYHCSVFSINIYLTIIRLIG
jgi:hypothetical protein